MRNRIGFDEPRSGWASLALSSCAILGIVFGFFLLGAGPLSADNRWCTPDGTCYFRQNPLPIRIYVGLAVLLLSPFLSVAGWRLGNRHYDSTADPGRMVHSISLVPDGRTLGKLGIFLSILIVLSAVAIGLFIREVFNHIRIF